MKKSTSLVLALVFSIILLLFTLSFVSAVEIDSCQTLDTENTIYNLNQSVNSSGTCFVINANNITLNGAGFMINWSQENNSNAYGVFVNLSNDTTIKNLQIVLGNESEDNFPTYAIYALNSTEGLIENNTVNISMGISAGFYIEETDNFLISNNTLKTYNSYYSYGIYLISSNNNVIENNFINSSSQAITLDTSGVNNTFDNNTLYSTYVAGSFSAGFYLSSGLGSRSFDNSTITNNYINTGGDEELPGLSISDINGAENFIIENNTIITNTNSSPGISGSTLVNATIDGNLITTHGNFSNGIDLYVINSTFSSNSITVEGVSSIGIRIGDNAPGFEGTHNNIFYDTSINSSNYYNVIIESTVYFTNNNIFVNVSYIGTNKSENVSSGELIRKWYLDVTIQDSSNAINEANVSTTNVSDDLKFSLLTNSSGRIARQELIEYININGTYSFWSNYTVNATKSGYVSASTQTNLSEYSSNVGNKDITLTLTSTSSNDEDSSSSSSGGGGGGSYSTLTPKQTELDEGYNKILFKNWKVLFKVNNESHTFKVEDVAETSAKISISSETQEATLLVGQEKKFEISGDNYYDILVKLNSIDSTNKLNPKANFTIQTISEEIISSQQESGLSEETTQTGSESEIGQEKTNLIWLWVVIAVIIILVISVVSYKRLEKQK